jgi:hypothetical protein
MRARIKRATSRGVSIRAAFTARDPHSEHLSRFVNCTSGISSTP